ncbi:hypothetical protein, partial [Acinetobacter nosocomialis]|uniref:hypothetical protein n=1 Tax=Acinetobacter nosocomialis TaxID=106654 RepID=UPI0005AB4A7D
KNLTFDKIFYFKNGFVINKIYVFMTKLIYWLTIKWQFFIIFVFYKSVLITCDKQLHAYGLFK